MLNSFLNINSLLTNASETYIYITTFFSLLANGLINFPSSQIIYLTLGYLININSFNFYVAILLGAIGNTIGNFILYYLIYNNSHFLNDKLAFLLNTKNETLNIYTEKFKNKWWGWLIIGKLTPSVKVFVPIICGLSKISASKSFVIFFVGSLVWASVVTYLGFYFGKQASLLNFYLIVTCVYIFVGLAGYLKLKYTEKKK